MVQKKSRPNSPDGPNQLTDQENYARVATVTNGDNVSVPFAGVIGLLSKALPSTRSFNLNAISSLVKYGAGYRVEFYAQARRSVYVGGISEREAAQRFGLARETVRKMLRYARPPAYQRRQPVRRPKLDPFTGVIDQILESDREQPRKQRHTAKRILDRLREEHGFDGGYSSVKEYVREKRLTAQEMFVPLVHPPGDAQADFGEALVVMAGVQRKARFRAAEGELPQQD